MSWRQRMPAILGWIGIAIAFAVMVWPVSARAAQAEFDGLLTWVAPNAYANGDALNPQVDLDFYTIYFGTTSRNYDIGTIQAGPGVTSSNVPPLQIPGTFLDGETINLFVAMTATVRDDPNNPAHDGSESPFSNEIQRSFLVSLTPVGSAPPIIQGWPVNVTCTAVEAGVTCEITPTN